MTVNFAFKYGLLAIEFFVPFELGFGTFELEFVFEFGFVIWFGI